MDSALVEANTEMTEQVTIDESEHLELESRDIYDQFNDNLKMNSLTKGEEKLSNTTDFVQQLPAQRAILRLLTCYSSIKALIP